MAGAVRQGVAYVGEVGGKFVGSANKVGTKMGAPVLRSVGHGMLWTKLRNGMHSRLRNW